MATFRRWAPPALLLPVFVALGCTSLLGIDGNYQSAAPESGGAKGSGGALGIAGEGPGGEGGGAAAGDGGDSNAGGNRESGGAEAMGMGGAGGGTTPSGGGGGGGAGDTTGAGGATGGTAGTGGAGTGGATSVACTAGTYVGTYSGTHKTSSSATFVPVYPSGSVTALVTNVDGGMPTMSLTFARTGVPLKDGIDAKLTFTFDCSQNGGTGPFQKDATISAAIPYVHGAIEGTVQASFKTPTTLKGSYTDDEVLVPDFATGKGTWEATLR